MVELYPFQNDVERVQESLDSAYSYLKLYKIPSLRADVIRLEGKYLLIMGRIKESQNLFLQAFIITDSI
ncbi:hypothetical protein BST97_10960 [Nonlabens spongiae]|uniref:Uncharacterized protein n=1 Tax=Nonlabens spongiae TaxID=331648 RepID=A0A1W6MLH6_9FLAO|nr:hypothetical protein BST97_10960 [Nonlabens spongiae]